jgi:tetratricopeptide (TPR) repeat protein
MKAPVILMALSLCLAANAQEPDARKLFEAGRYEQAIDAINSQPAEPSPDAIYLAGQIYLRLNQRENARSQFARLATTPWSLVGESATALVDGNRQLAVESATRAVEQAPDQFSANYQLGLAQSSAERWEPAAAAFEKATAIDPSSAYAHYYAGLAYSKITRVDQMAMHFEYFLKLAPEAPERPAVMSLMRSVRGR